MGRTKHPLRKPCCADIHTACQRWKHPIELVAVRSMQETGKTGITHYTGQFIYSDNVTMSTSSGLKVRRSIEPTMAGTLRNVPSQPASGYGLTVVSSSNIDKTRTIMIADIQEIASTWPAVKAGARDWTSPVSNYSHLTASIQHSRFKLQGSRSHKYSLPQPIGPIG